MVTDWLQRLFNLQRATPPGFVPPGLYHALREAGGEYTRFHLRVEPDGSGMLIANATAATQLTPSGVVIVKGLLDGKDEDAIIKQLTRGFEGASETMMRQDIEMVRMLISDVVTPGDRYPIFNLEDAAISPYAARLLAPLQASLPLAEPERLLPLLDRLWEAGIPHVTFLIQPPAGLNAEHLLRAIERAEEIGMIAGVRGRALDIRDVALLQRMHEAGVDHVTLLYASSDPAVHDALCGAGDHAAAEEIFNWLETQAICAIAETPLTPATVDTLPGTVDAMARLGVDTIAFVAYATVDAATAERDGALKAEAMPQVATTIEEMSNQNAMRFIWDPPVQRVPGIPLDEQVRRGPRTTGDVAVHVEPDGEVYPPRGPYRSAGNLLSDPWQKIWNHDAFRIYRERVEAPTRCESCPGLTICAADCPAEPAGWSQPPAAAR